MPPQEQLPPTTEEVMAELDSYLTPSDPKRGFFSRIVGRFSVHSTHPYALADTIKWLNQYETAVPKQDTYQFETPPKTNVIERLESFGLERTAPREQPRRNRKRAICAFLFFGGMFAFSEINAATNPADRYLYEHGIADTDDTNKSAQASTIVNPESANEAKAWYEYSDDVFEAMPNGTYKLPFPDNGLYTFFGYDENDNPLPGGYNPPAVPEARCASLATIQFAYNLAHELRARLPEVNLAFGEFNSDLHYSHRKSLDFDLHDINSAPSFRSQQLAFTSEDAITIADTMLESGMVEMIFYNDPVVANVINEKYGRYVVLTTEYGHWNHFHIRLYAEYGGIYAISCNG